MTEEQRITLGSPVPEMKEAMSVAQFKAITALLAGEWTNKKVVEKQITTERLYTHSTYYGLSIHHILTLQYDGDVLIEQNNQEEKYQNRVNLEAAEIEPILRQLLIWHLAKVADSGKADDWDNHPFGDDPEEPDHEGGPSEDMGTPDGIAIFTFNGGGTPIVAVKKKGEPESEGIFSDGIENAYSPRPDDGPIII